MENLLQYEKIFGLEKMQFLFGEFQNKAQEELQKADSFLKSGKINALRLTYHNMRAASLVFGMNKFSEQCALIEENIINGKIAESLEKDIKLSKIMFDAEIKEVHAYLNRGKNV